MTVMKFVQLFILKKKLKETIMQENAGNNHFSMFQSASSNQLLDLTCISCKEKYMELLEKLKIIQTYTPPPNVRIPTQYSCGKQLYNSKLLCIAHLLMFKFFEKYYL